MSKRKIRVEDLRKFKFVSDPQISPDGGEIAFVLSTIDHEKDAYERHIWMANRASGEVGQFTFGMGNDTYPRWSPVGRQLLFLSNGRDPEEKRTQIWVIPRSGGEARLAVEAEESISNPKWAPDSKWVLFHSKVWTEEKPETDVKVIKRIKYKMNGVGTFEGRRTHLFYARIGVKPRRLTDGEFDVEAASWSPSGKQIAFVTNMDEGADISRVTDIFIIPSSGGEPRKLTEGEHAISNISFSPDGKRLAFVGNDRPERLAVNQNLWVMPADGGEMRNLTSAFDRGLGMGVGADLRVATPDPGAVWSPDGGSIYFLTASTPHSNVYKVAAGGGPVELVIGGRVIDGFSMSANGSVIAFNALDATHPAELWTRDGEGESQLTSFNDRLLEGLDLSTPESFTFKNGLGKDIDGWIMRPAGFKEGERYPTVLEIHGGPRSVYGDGIFHEFQVLAAEGYTVIYTNPRGSAGYGEDYAEAVMGHYGEGDYDDLMVFVDEALKQCPFIDEARLGVTGGSYGGYMTNWIVSHTGRFRAAVTFRSVCNWVSKFGCSDVGYMQPESISGRKTFWGEDIMEQLRHSPLMYAGNVKTPILIVHSENDLRCPIEQAEQWFVALKLRGVETELVRFPNETHELSRSGKPKHREERLRHMIRWFDEQLKQPPG
jgi:dipeptidyl aminopeptidase/acylaminoacyl peptidase